MHLKVQHLRWAERLLGWLGRGGQLVRHSAAHLRSAAVHVQFGPVHRTQQGVQRSDGLHGQQRRERLR